MQTVFFKDMPVEVYGTIPAPGSEAKPFELTDTDLQPVKLADYKGSNLILNIFPSLDTEVCAMSVRRFNKEVASLDNTQVLCVSIDLPFASKRFCTTQGIENLKVASAFRHPEFGAEYGVQMVDGPLKGLLARAVVLINPQGQVIYSQLVDQITNEPDYEAVKYALKHD